MSGQQPLSTCRTCHLNPSGLTSRRSQPPLALAVPLSRFTSRVGGGSAFYVRMKHITHKQRRQQQYAKRKRMFVLAFCFIVIPAMLVLFARALSHLRSGDRSIAWYSYGQPVGYFLLLVFSGLFLSLAVITVFR